MGPVGVFEGTDMYSPLLTQVSGALAPPLSEWDLQQKGLLMPDPALIDKSMLKALLKVKGSHVDLGVALAEARKTAELLGKTSTGIANSLDAFMAKNWKALGKMASWKKLPAKYLELSYGWTPLLNDVYNSCESLATIRENGSLLSLDVSGYAKDMKEVEVDRGGYMGIPVKTTVQSRSLYQTKLVYQVPSGFLGEFSALGLTNPLAVAWELVPYSFVLDWVLPIGDWLSALDAGAFLDFKEGSQSYIERVQATGSEPNPTPPATVIKWQASEEVVRGFRFVRNLAWPYQPMLPSLRSPLSLDKMAKGLSLLTQVMRKWA
jgi:hypothetical protein